MKKTWKNMKEIINHSTRYEILLPRKIIIKKEEIADQKEIAAEFNTFLRKLVRKWSVKFLTHQIRLKVI